ncbi:DUF1349 domain-containing protein [Prauserella alba]|uniref:DUF1349 domain-containing protein n=1 Tax=Prauserella alba TaxID=176898 RepID=A0ABP4G3F3_9PSEU|nr:DUF1349 domain-containing protein [Prauserella alba]MCP2182737.1 hypothetical protein [Prauserella alba]
MNDSTSVFGLTGWRWFNPPTNYEFDGTGLRVTTDEDTDFWVTTHYGFVRDTGHALLRPVGAQFRLTATFQGEYHEQYDQAGLLLRGDAHNWIKTGIEFVDGEPLLSAVVTREVSDWNVVPLTRIAGRPTSVTIDVRRVNDTVTVRYGWDDHRPDTLLRMAYFPPDAKAEAGPMCASPDGTGFAVRFADVTYEEHIV